MREGLFMIVILSAGLRFDHRFPFRMIRPVLFSLLCLGLGIGSLVAVEIPRSPELPKELPWDLKELAIAPKFEWTDTKAPLKALIYEGEKFHGKTSRVFAYYGTPAMFDPAQKGPWPGIVLVHGGGGTAFREWVTLWAKRGYVAIAMDLSGMRPDDADNKKRERITGGGPDQGHPAKFETIRTEDVTDDWPYHAVANVILAHSLLLSFPEVIQDKTALTGISWGGYTTCLVASIDARFKAAVPVYGCGFLNEDSSWLGEFEKLGPEMTRRWVSLYDPSRYLPACRVPIFFVGGTNDFAYPLDSYMKSFDEVTHAPKNIREQVKMPHGHGPGWAPPEIGAFVDSVLLGKAKLPKVSMPERKGESVRAKVTGAPVKSAVAHYAPASDAAINKMEWTESPTMAASGDETELVANVPPDARAVFFNVITDSGLMVSSPVLLKH
jgi:dienelactone hydrolase